MLSKVLNQFDWHPTTLTMIAGALVIIGFALSGISWWYISLAALGTFGPGILREAGVIQDQDEFQRRATHKAGYHAFLVVGLFSFLLVGYLRATEVNIGNPDAIVSLILAILWFTWFLSSLLSYWGLQKTISRILYSFGTIWLVFSILANLEQPVGMLMQSLLVIPFFLLSYMSKKWPKISGGLLIAASIFFFYYLGLYEIFGPNPLEKGRGEVIILFVSPLLVCGVLLLKSESNDDD